MIFGGRSKLLVRNVMREVYYDGRGQSTNNPYGKMSSLSNECREEQTIRINHSEFTLLLKGAEFGIEDQTDIIC